MMQLLGRAVSVVRRWHDRVRGVRSRALRWPRPEFALDKEPHFLFAITPPFAGSTALSQILNSGPSSTLLHVKGEGQWLVPGMCEPDRWERVKVIDWESVRAVWLHHVQHLGALSGRQAEVVIEKSPPNLVRIDHIVAAFPNSTLFGFNRDPYANVSSILSRHPGVTTMDESERNAIAARGAAEWMFRSRWIRKWVSEMRLPWFTYERFCAEPSACVAMVTAVTPALQGLDTTIQLRVGKYAAHELRNFNEDQVSRLTRGNIDAVSHVLRQDPDVLAFFGYSPMR